MAARDDEDRHWLSPREEALLQRAVERAVADTLLKMGVKSTDAADVLELQRDFRFVREFRTSSEKMGKQAVWVAVSTFIVGGLSALWLGVQAALRNFPPGN